MPSEGHDRISFDRGIRVAVAWLHEEAKRMNDPHARAVLNNAAFHLGTAKLSRVEPSDETR